MHTSVSFLEALDGEPPPDTSPFQEPVGQAWLFESQRLWYARAEERQRTQVLPVDEKTTISWGAAPRPWRQILDTQRQSVRQVGASCGFAAELQAQSVLPICDASRASMAVGEPGAGEPRRPMHRPIECRSFRETLAEKRREVQATQAALEEKNMQREKAKAEKLKRKSTMLLRLKLAEEAWSKTRTSLVSRTQTAPSSTVTASAAARRAAATTM